MLMLFLKYLNQKKTFKLLILLLSSNSYAFLYRNMEMISENRVLDRNENAQICIMQAK